MLANRALREIVMANNNFLKLQSVILQAGKLWTETSISNGA